MSTFEIRLGCEPFASNYEGTSLKGAVKAMLG